MILNLAKNQWRQCYMSEPFVYIWRWSTMSSQHHRIDLLVNSLYLKLWLFTGKFPFHCFMKIVNINTITWSCYRYIVNNFTTFHHFSHHNFRFNLPLQLLLGLGLSETNFSTTNVQCLRQDFATSNSEDRTVCFSTSSERNKPRLFQAPLSKLCVGWESTVLKEIYISVDWIGVTGPDIKTTPNHWYHEVIVIDDR